MRSAASPALQFDGVDDFLQSLGNLTYGPFTVFAVWTTAQDSAIYDRGGNESLLSTTNPTVTVSRGGVVSAKNLAAGWGNDGAVRITTHQFAGTHASHKLWINGAPQSLTDFAANDPGAATYAAAISVGGRAASLFQRGFLAELLVYDRALPHGYRRLVEHYLSRKWGVAVQ